jgi:hypothetical protein
LAKLGHGKSAITCHQRAIALSGGDALLFHNLGTALSASGQYGDAVIAFTRALERDPNYHLARWDRALAYLHLGNYHEGFKDYEVRRITGQLPSRTPPGLPWEGGAYGGKTLVLLVEQGFGDTLWVARYLPRVKALGGRLVVECQPELAPLIAAMRVADVVVARGQALPDAELHCFLCSLPGLFTRDIGTIPAAPYLPAPQDRYRKLAPLFADEQATRLKVGIVWSGSTTFQNNHRRAQPLLAFLQAFAMPSVQLYSLQKGPPARQLTELPRGAPVIDLAPHLDDFADTAAAISCLDLVIMTDSAVAHLAGALGKPVWVLLGQGAHWLSLHDRSDSPWYPSLRLFRPRAEGDWNHVFDAAAVELMTLAAQRNLER